MDPKAPDDGVVPEITRAASPITGEVEKLPDTNHTDVGLSMYEEALRMDIETLERLSRRVRIKLDFGLLPVMCFIYLMSFLDKQTLNYGNAYTLQADLGLTGSNYSWVASIINFGIVVASYPANLALQKFPIGKIVATMLMCWGLLNMCSAAARNFRDIMAIRFLLGVFEAPIAPAWVLLTSIFWTREEQPLRMCFWLGCNGIASMLGAGVSWGVGHYSGSSLAAWQLIFLIIGAFTFGLGVASFFFLPSGPHDVFFLTREEKLAAVWRVARNQTGVKNPRIMVYQIKEALMDPRVILVALQQLVIGIANGSLTNFQSALLKGFGFDSQKTVLYQLPNGAFELVCTVAAGFITSNVPNTLAIVIGAAMVPDLAGIIGIRLIPLDQQLPLAACCWITAAFGASIILNWTVVAANFAGHTKRTTVNSINFIFYYAGNIIGPFLFISSEAPKYPTAVNALIAVFSFAIADILFLGFMMAMMNRRRDAAAAVAVAGQEGGDQAEEAIDGFTDHTDKEIRSFRYKW